MAAYSHSNVLSNDLSALFQSGSVHIRTVGGLLLEAAERVGGLHVRRPLARP